MVLTVIKFVPTLSVDELINVMDELPNIVRFSKIVKLPLIVCVAFCEPVVKKEAVREFNVYGDNIEPVCVFNTKLLV
jgi:hypothetical protein